jgi:hypothetical protein
MPQDITHPHLIHNRFQIHTAKQANLHDNLAHCFKTQTPTMEMA